MYYLTGGHAVSLASEQDLNVFATIGQCPFLGVIKPLSFSLLYLQMVAYAIADAIMLALGFNPILIPATAEPGTIGIMATPDSKSGMGSIVTSVPGA